jgi:hypothetical protein
MEILKDIGVFVWAVLGTWQAYMTGGIVIALLGVYERVTKKTISLRTFIIGVFAFLLVAFFLAWRDQYHGVITAKTETEKAQKKLEELTQPKFELAWGSFILGNDTMVRGHHIEKHTHGLDRLGKLPLEIQN